MAESVTLPWHRPCPACGEDCPIPRYNNLLAPMEDLDLSYQVATCRTCGMAYAADLARPETYERYYQELSKYDLPVQTGPLSPLIRTRIDAALALALTDEALSSDSIICDIGCGTGALLHGFSQAGFHRIHGIDPAPAAAREAQRRFGLRGIQVGLLRQAPDCLPLADTRLLCLTGVLEHLTQPVEDLAPLLAALPEDTRILIEVPALERFTVGPLEPFGEFSLEHLQYFSTATLDRLMARLGLSRLSGGLVSLSGCTDSLFGLFARRPSPRTSLLEHCEDWLGNYLAAATPRQVALEATLSGIDEDFVIFGAGSHTARLLPTLERLGLAGRVRGIVDNNLNLHGKQLGPHVVGPANDFSALPPDLPVVVSSFFGQRAMARQLPPSRRRYLLYPDAP